MSKIDFSFLSLWFAEIAPWSEPIWVVLFSLTSIRGWYVWRNLINSDKHPDSYDRLIEQLRENNWGKRYLNALGWALDKVGYMIGDRDKHTQSVPTEGRIYRFFGYNPFTAESYEKCLYLAFLYPLLSFLITWALGGSGLIGDVEFFGEESADISVRQRCLGLGVLGFGLWGSLKILLRLQGYRQWFVLGGLLLMWSTIARLFNDDFLVNLLAFSIVFIYLYFTLYAGRWLGGYMLTRSTGQAHITAHAFAVAGAFAVTGAVAGTGTVAGAGSFTVAGFGFGFVAVGFAVAGASAVAVAVAVAVAGAGAVAVAGADPFAGAVAIAGAAMVTVFLQAIQKKSVTKGRAGAIWLFYSLITMLLVYGSLNYLPDDGYALLLMFWAILPLVNAPLDWLSLGVTRGMLQALRMGRHNGWIAFFYGLLDVIFAVLFLFIIAAVLVLATALTNVVSGEPLINMVEIFSALRNDPTDVNYWWVYFLLLSTLVPTIIHFALVGGAATLWVPKAIRQKLADNMSKDLAKIWGAWAFLTFTPLIGLVGAPLLLLMGLYALLQAHGSWLGWHLLEWAEWLALAVQG